MNKITDIKKLRNNTYLVTIIKNTETKTHILTEDTLIDYNILQPRTITNDEYKNIIQSNEFHLLYQKSLHFIEYQMRSISEVKKNLKKFTKDETLINRIITELKNNNYLSDALYVKEYVNEKIQYDMIGPKSIKDKLIQKGIHFDLIDAELLQFTDELQFSKVEELIQKELRYPIKKTYLKAYQSLKQKLVSKGFSLRIIDSLLQSFSDVIKESCLEDELIIKDLQKLKQDYNINNYNDKQKVIQKLLSKGYDYNLIKKHL